MSSVEEYRQDKGNPGYDFEDFLEDEIKDSAFRVSIFPNRFGYHIIFLLIPVLFYIFFSPFLSLLDSSDMSEYSSIFRFVLFLTFVMGICFIGINCGKEVIVSGRGIVLRKFFIINESLNVNDVEKCEVITGLTSHGRYHTEHYSKAVIYYDGGKVFSLTDNMYKGWSRLVQYMEMNKKVVRIDGRSKLQKSLDDLLGGK